MFNYIEADSRRPRHHPRHEHHYKHIRLLAINNNLSQGRSTLSSHRDTIHTTAPLRMEHKSQSPPGYPDQEPFNSGLGASATHHAAPPRRVRDLLVGNFFGRVLAFSMSVAAIALASVLTQNSNAGFGYREAQLMV
jgi:hypothetical protein